VPAKDSSPKHIGSQLAKYRRKRGLTQEDVGVRLDIGAEAVSRMERGLVELTVSKLLQLADIFDCPADELLLVLSTRPQDQSQVLTTRLKALKANDRQFALTVLDQLTEHLATR